MPRPSSADGFDDEVIAAGRSHTGYLALVPAAIVVAALYFGRPVLLPLAIAILLAFALAPLVGALRRIGVGHAASVLLSGLLAVALMIGVLVFVGSQAVKLTERLPLYQSNLLHKIETVRGRTIDDQMIARASSMVQKLRDQLFGTNPAGRQSPAPGLSTQRGPQPVPVEIREPNPAPLELFFMAGRPLVVPLAEAAIVLIFVMFILLHKEDIRDRFVRLAGSHDMQRTTLLLDEGAEKLSRFLLTQAAINISFGSLIACGLWLIGIPTPVLWGLNVAILRFIPYVGVPLAAIPPVVLALSVDPGWSMVAWSVALFAGGELILGQAIEPWLFGRRMGMSPVAIVAAATFWTWLWGPLGLLLSTPLTMCLMVLGRHVDHLRFLDVLLGNRPALAAEEALYLRMLGDDADEAAAEAENFLKENSLCCYYDSVVLKGLALAQADVSRGALDHDRVLRIRDTTRALIQNLSEVETQPAARHVGKAELPRRRRVSREPVVLCVAGRGPLDEAAASLLIHLLEQAGIGAGLISSNQASASHIGTLDVVGIKLVCLCYLEPGNFSRARYLLRRLRHRLPEAPCIAAFWGYSDGDKHASDAVECDVVTGLEEGLQKILAALEGDVPGPVRRSGVAEDKAAAGADRLART